MSRLTYKEQLQDVRWQKLRLKCLEGAQWKCQICHAADKQLHVHHRAYVKGRMAWEYSEKELSVLCNRHHEIEHAAKDILEELILAIPSVQYAQVCALVAGFLWAQYQLPDNIASSVRQISPEFFDDAAQGRRFGLSPESFAKQVERLKNA